MQEAKTYSPLESDFSYCAAAMDAVRKLILDRSEELDKDLSGLSKKLGRNHAYLQQFIKRGIPRNLPEQLRPLLASELGVDESQLRGAGLQPGKKAEVTPANARVIGNTRIDKTIPVYGHAVGGKDGSFVLNGNKAADILAPPSLINVPDAYAVYVVGNSMADRYYAGEVVFVNPKLPVRRDDFVVVQIAATVEGDPPLAYVKRFISMDDRRLRLAQLSPRKTLEFPRQRVVSVHRIIMGGDG
jgi:phage repressor protein C with HTH and peptisase S24 domain